MYPTKKLTEARTNIGGFFGPVAKALYCTFLPALFGEPIDPDDPRLALAPLPVKHAGLALPNPVDSAGENYKASTLLCSHLLAALKGSQKFSSADHRATISGVRAELRERNSTVMVRHLPPFSAIFLMTPAR